MMEGVTIKNMHGDFGFLKYFFFFMTAGFTTRSSLSEFELMVVTPIHNIQAIKQTIP